MSYLISLLGVCVPLLVQSDVQVLQLPLHSLLGGLDTALLPDKSELWCMLSLRVAELVKKGRAPLREHGY